MLFHSLAFAAFFLATLAVYWVTPGRHRLTTLLAASYLFYATWSVPFIGLILVSTTIDYAISHALVATDNACRRRRLLTVCIVLNLLILATFKYCNFFLDGIGSVWRLIGFTGTVPHLDVILPLGISFYTFEAISYVVDVYRGAHPVRSYRLYALYIMFFPHLIAGPIVRFRDIIGQFEAGPQLDGRRIRQALVLLAAGLLGKTVLADNLAPIADTVFAHVRPVSSLDAWLGTLAFSGQIYFDFAAYTAMAQGCALLLGFALCRNFDSPYLSRNIQQFWQRWHMSLSSWLRDYLYIPLGGSRVSAYRTYLNLIITMGLGGLWHGAGLQFIIWGLLHGLYLAVHRLYSGWIRHTDWVRMQKHGLWQVTSGLITFICVAIAWIFFRAPDLPTATYVLGSLISAGWQLQVVDTVQLVWVACVVGCYPVIASAWRRWQPHKLWIETPTVPMTVLFVLGVVLSWTVLAASSTQAFIYFQF